MTELDPNDLIPRSDLRVEIAAAVSAAIAGLDQRLSTMWRVLFGSKDTLETGLVERMNDLQEKVERMASQQDQQMTILSSIQKSQEQIIAAQTSTSTSVTRWTMNTEMIKWVGGALVALGLVNVALANDTIHLLARLYLGNILRLFGI